MTRLHRCYDSKTVREGHSCLRLIDWTDLHEHLATILVVASIEEFLDKLSVCGGSVSLLAETHVLKKHNSAADIIR